MKRVVSTLLALMLVLALVGTAAAAGEGSITIDNAVNGKTYTIYRIFDLNSHNTDYSAINYKVSEKWKAFFEGNALGLNYVDIENDYVTWKDGASAADFAAAAIQFAKDNGIVNDGQQKADSSTVKFADLDLGYYLVQSDLGALCSLDTTMSDVTIKEKNSESTVDKTVKEDSDKTFGKTNDADIGQTVEFKTVINVVDGLPKKYVLHDKMSDGLTFDKNVEVKIGDRTLTAGTDYTLVTKPDLDDDCTFEIHFTDTTVDGVQSSVLKPNDVVTVTYSATVNANAVVGGAGNENKTKLDYGDTKYTEWDLTHTYVWQFDVLKYTMKNDTKTPLAGAQFKLYKEVDDTKNYVIVDANNKVTGWTTDETKASVFTTHEDGEFKIIGLDADTYYLEETEAPAGYNKLAAPVKVKIEASTDGGTGKVTYNETATGTVEIENRTGTELPSTGGIGTTVFYVIGGLLMTVAVVLLVTKKKMSATK